MITALSQLSADNALSTIYEAVASAIVSGCALGCVGLWVGALRKGAL